MISEKKNLSESYTSDNLFNLQWQHLKDNDWKSKQEVNASS